MTDSRTAAVRSSAHESAAEPEAPPLESLLARIAAIDQQIAQALNDRTEVARELLQLGGSERLEEVIAPLVEARGQRGDGFPARGLTAVYREILSAIRSLASSTVVAFLGPQGTFSHQAAIQHFGSQIELEPAGSLSEVFALVERGLANFGIVPVENSIEGAVTETLDTLVESELRICGELTVAIGQNLLSQSGQIADVRRVASHPQPIGQCRDWIRRNLPAADVVETTSTTAAAQLAADDASVAAIGSVMAAEVYGLEVAEHSIEDRRGNATRFAVVGREQPARTGRDLTSAVFTVHKDQSGTLFRLLEPFARHEVSLTTIQSRPMKGKAWEYLFFVDLVGHEDDEAVSQALAEAAKVAYSHKILGSFPRAATPVASPGGGGEGESWA